MRELCVVIAWVLLFSASTTQGAEYFIYQDPAGRIVLSNITPSPEAKVIKRDQLPDVTDEEVRAARERERAFWQRLKDEELAESNRKLAESNYQLTQAVITAAALRGSDPDTLVQVAVSDAVPFDRFHSGRLPQRGRLNSGFRGHSRRR